MKQEQIKELLERIRSNKNNETNELVATAEEVSLLNATTEATMSVASARALTTTTISADNYLWLESYDENGNACEEPIIGNYEGSMYVLVGRVDMSALLAANNISASADLTACSLTLYGDAGNFSWAYSIYDINGNFVTYYYGSGMQVYVPLKEVYDASGDWFFVLEPATGYNCLHFSGAGDLEVSYEESYNENPLAGISITTLPINTQYIAGEMFNPAGMVVTATYEDGSTEAVTGYTCSPSGALTTSNSSVTIFYTEEGVTKTANVSISVEALEVDAPDYKQHYLDGNLGETSYRVNLRTGRVNFNKTIKKLSGNKSPLSLRMVYNTSTNASSATTGQWKLNAEQKIIQKDANTLYYIDANFRIHTFKKLANSLYYDTDHTGMLIRGSNKNYVLTDDSAVEMLFDEYNRLTTVRKYGKSNVVYMEIEYNADNSFKVTDGMGRNVSATSSTIGTAMLTYTNGDLTKIEDSKGETVSYTYDNANNLTKITANCESVVFTYDENQRVQTILYSVNNQPVKKEFISYLDSVTEVKETKYSVAESEAYTINSYKFDSDGKLIATIEKDSTDENEQILKAKYYSPDLYENYTINLDPKNCTCGQYHLYDYENEVLVGRFDDLPVLNAGEKYVMFAAFDKERLFSGIENGNLEIWLDDGSNDITKAHQVMAIDANSESELPFEWLEVEFPAYTGEGFVEFAFVGDYNPDVQDLGCVYIYKTSVSTQKECITSTETSISGTELTEHVERKSNGNTTWVEISECIFPQSFVSDCEKITAADWQLTKRNMAMANEEFVVWYNDLGKAIYTSSVPDVIVNGNSSHNMGELNWATLQTQNITTVFEYATYDKDAKDGSMTLTQNENKPSYQAACTSYIDRYGRTYKTVNSKGVTTETTYDDYDRVTKTEITSSLGKMKTSTLYTPLESGTYREIHTDEYGKVWTYVYNYDTGDLISMTDPKEYEQTYTYDTKRRPTQIAQSTSENVLAYDDTKDLISALTHDTGAYAFTYDGYQQVNSVKYNNAALLTKTYDFTPNRDTMETTYANGGKMTCVSDKYGNPLSVTDTQNNEKLLSYVYGSIMYDFADFTERACQNKSEILRKKCHQNIDNAFNVVYNYDILKRLSSIIRNDGVTINYEYDTENRLTKESVYDIEDIVYEYDYYDGDVMTSEQLREVDVDINNIHFITTNDYDKFERITTKNQVLDLLSYGQDGIDYSYEYETNTIGTETCTSSRIKTLTAKVWRYNQEYQDDVTYTQTLTYDDNGNIQTISNGANSSVTYTYDDRNRLTQEENTALNRKYVFTYNDGGNITLKKEYNKSTGALLHTYSYSYSNDRLTNFDGTAITYDACGNPLSYKGNTLTWTRGRLLASYGNITFQYDGEGFRRKKAHGNDTVTYYYQDGKLLSEKHTSAPDLFFLYNGNEIVGFVENGGIGYFYRKDALGNVVAMYNAAGEEVASYTYDAWGNCTIGTNVDGLADLNPIRYRGYYYDKETQLYYLQTRYYDPATGRFISSDTVEYLDPKIIHGLNLYAYGLNNPVMYVDPTGHKRKLLLSVLCIAAIVYVAELIISELIDLHYSRIEKGNEYQFPEDYEAVSEDEQNYMKGLANCHQFSAETYGDNKKVMTKDGRYEAIYNEDGKLVTDPRDIGTYNYCNPVTDPIGHFFADVLPWILWGNSEEDSTNIFQRIGGMIGIH